MGVGAGPTAPPPPCALHHCRPVTSTAISSSCATSLLGLVLWASGLLAARTRTEQLIASFGFKQAAVQDLHERVSDQWCLHHLGTQAPVHTTWPSPPAWTMISSMLQVHVLEAGHIQGNAAMLFILCAVGSHLADVPITAQPCTGQALNVACAHPDV